MPLVYGGQEEPLRKRLEFFVKDPIGFKDYEYQDFYTSLLHLKKDNEALWNGEFGARARRIDNGDEVLSFERVKGDNSVKVYINFTNQEKNVTLAAENNLIDFQEKLSEAAKLNEDELQLGPWGYAVYSK